MQAGSVYNIGRHKVLHDSFHTITEIGSFYEATVTLASFTSLSLAKCSGYGDEATVTLDTRHRNWATKLVVSRLILTNCG